MLYISKQARQNFPLLYKNKDTIYRGVVATILESWRFKSSRLQEEKRQPNTVDYLFINMYSFKTLYHV